MSGTIAFPPNPTDGQLYTFNNTTWMWSASRGAWVNANTGAVFVPLSGGTMTGPLALVGVTNGSSAPAGQVGEYINAANPSAVVLTGSGDGTITNITSIVLTPGQWLLWGWFQLVLSNASSVGIAGAISESASSTAGFWPTQLVSSVALGGSFLSICPVVVNIQATTTYYLNVAGWWSGGTVSPSANAVIFALRVR